MLLTYQRKVAEVQGEVVGPGPWNLVAGGREEEEGPGQM